jgi:hypothetical protein
MQISNVLLFISELYESTIFLPFPKAFLPLSLLYHCLFRFISVPRLLLRFTTISPPLTACHKVLYTLHHAFCLCQTEFRKLASFQEEDFRVRTSISHAFPLKDCKIGAMLSSKSEYLFSNSSALSLPLFRCIYRRLNSFLTPKADH